MKSFFSIAVISILSSMICFAEPAKPAEPIGSRSKIVAYNGEEKHVADLVSKIVSENMNGWLLSEDKNAKWLLLKLKILSSDTIYTELSDGNGSESIVFDWNPNSKIWTIIKRSPIGDWKPKEARKGSRLTHLLFLKQGQNKAAHTNPLPVPSRNLNDHSNP